MIGQIIQSYLVSLGVQIDKPGFQQADATIKQTAANIDRATSGMARNFVKASAIITTAMASVTASVVGLMRATAKEDLAMQKYARTMLLSEDAAWRMKKATDALGESMNDIALTPELYERYKQLTADGSQMMVGGDFKQTMKDFRDLLFEFQRLKQEASYALNWVGYYLMKYLQRPLGDIKEKFKSFNDSVIKNMRTWTEKIARGIYYIIEVGRHFLEFLGDIGRHLKKLWDSFPEGAKKAIAAITAINVALAAGPLGRSIMLLSGLLLLIDDYYGYMEGKEAALGPYWDKLNAFLERAQEGYDALLKAAEPFWETVTKYAKIAGEYIGEVVKKVAEWGETTGAGLLDSFIEEVKEVAGIIWDLWSAMGELRGAQLKAFYEALGKTDAVESFTDVLKGLWDIVKGLWGGLKDVLRFLAELYREMAKSDAAKDMARAAADLWAVIVKLGKVIVEVAQSIAKKLFGEMRKTHFLYAFKNILELIYSVVSLLITGFSKMANAILDLFKTAAQSKEFNDFWVGFGKVLDKVLEKLGKVAKTCALLMKGDWAAAKALWDRDETIKKGTEAGTGDTDWNKRVVYERFKKAGYSDEAIAGIMGRLQQEHSFNTSEVEEYDDPETGLHLGGLGMFQWNGGRTTRMKKWAADNGLDYLDPGAQADFAIIEAYERGLTPDYMNGMSPEEAATAWTDEWEVGEHGGERKYARDIFDEIQNNAPWMSSQMEHAPKHNVHLQNLEMTDAANKELQLRFLSAVAAMSEHGYYFNAQSASDNSIGFTTNEGMSEGDIRAMADIFKKEGLYSTRDEHGWYVSLDPDRKNPTYEDYAQYGAETDKVWQKSAKDYFDDAGIKPMNGLDGELMIEILKKAVTMPRDIMRPTSTASLADGNYQAGALGLATGKYQLSGTAGFMDTGGPSPLQQVIEIINQRAAMQQRQPDSTTPTPHVEEKAAPLAQLMEIIGRQANVPMPNMDNGNQTAPLAQLMQLMDRMRDIMPQPNYQAVEGLLSGFHDYGGNTVNNRQGDINIDVDVTINGANKTNQDVAQEIANEVERYARFQRNNIGISGAVLV